jgi:HSP20 family protein
MARKTMERRGDRLDWWPELVPRRVAEWLDWPVLSTLREAEHLLHVEEFTEGDCFVVRAEMPGIDPEKDVKVEVRDHCLEIRAERRERTTGEHEGVRRSEFRYGSFFRGLAMPPNAKESDIRATYEDGILEVRVPLAHAPEPEAKAIPVEHR